MNAAHDQVIRCLAAGGQRASGVASVLCRLVTEGGELGELEPVLAADGETVIRKIPPAHWFERLAIGLDRGAFDRPLDAEKVKRIAARILTSPAEDAKT